MADIQILGCVRSVRYLEDSCIVKVEEVKRGYKRANGEYVDDKSYQWTIVFKEYFKKYISTHFHDGQIVQIKGEILPYAISHGELVDGYSAFGQTINLASMPKYVKREAKMLKESQENVDDTPSLGTYMQDDF